MSVISNILRSTQSRAMRSKKFQSYEDEALFWDTHSPEDFASEFKTVQAKFQRPMRIRLAVPLEPSAVEQLERIGKEQGIEPVALARQWIMERLSSIMH